ncbi:ent-kaurene oxidase 2-like [Aristolochia californica]|uniref:ent-kaurene oxidase 2-like n=1 Tax=Aristolochia californica TaxID=171875 RepID=UPI0035D79925
MEWAMFELARNTECQEKLYQEIKEVCGASKASEDHLPRMPYLNAVFHELQRKHPSVSILPTRYTHEDTQIGGYHISAGSQIAINIYACNMDKKQWEDPEKWKPERFLNEDFELMDIHRSMAFGAGKRACIGASQAAAILCTAMARFLQEFKWSISEDDAGDENTFAFTSHRLKPLEAILAPRT